MYALVLFDGAAKPEKGERIHLGDVKANDEVWEYTVQPQQGWMVLLPKRIFIA